ncbi:MAG TPA: amidase [Gemmataceae bacterium]|nr:amidase [Gemmataceae bacterium]
MTTDHRPRATDSLTIHQAAAALRAGRLSPVDLLETCLANIDRFEAQVRAWVFVDREGAYAEAERLTAELKRGQYRGPLHGIPLGIKDIFDVFDWPTAAGSRRWINSIARRDATVVQRLRQAGAVFLGKTVTTQYASFDPPPTRNPHDPGRTPGGSSSGSAAAVATGMCLGALGSQTGGSITRPATYCGAAGCKPTFGRVSGDGVLPLAPSMDHVGPIARCVRDLAILLQAIAGPDPRDPLCADRAVPDLVAALDRPLPPPRLGRLRGLFDERAEPPVREMMEQVIASYRGRGAAVVDVALPASFAEVIPRHRTVMAVEAAAYHGPRLRRYPDDYDRQIRGLVEEGLACPADEYARCKEHQRQLAREMLACFDGVDALLTPATTGPAPDASTTGDPAFNSPWSYTGLPTVSFPTARDPSGLPLGVQLIGRPWAEAELLAVAAWCETGG